MKNVIPNTLINTAHEETLKILEANGNVVSKLQSNALRELCTFYASPNGRRMAFPLPCGVGKTSSIRGFLKALTIMGVAHDKRIIICAEKVEALCELKRNLINDDGIEEDLISLLHSYEHNPKFKDQPIERTASEPADKDYGTFTLLTHMKFRKAFEKLPSYDLLIHDEALVLGDGLSIEVAELEAEIARYITLIQGRILRATDDQKELVEWLSSIHDDLDGDNGDIVSFDPLPMTLNETIKAAKSIRKDNQVLISFIRNVGEGISLRLLRDQQGSHVLSIDNLIPKDLRNIAVLDASYSIRHLMSYDKSIEEHRINDSIKSYENVCLHIAKAKAGRNALFGSLSGDQTVLIDEVAHIADREASKGRNVLIFTFKDVGIMSPSNTLKRRMKSKNVRFLTWGHETAINSYSDCDVVIFCGVLTLPVPSVAAMALAHSGDIRTPITNISTIVRSEKVHSLYQALSRGCCRKMVNGKASSMDAYIFCHDAFSVTSSLKTVMKGVKVKHYMGKR